MDTSADRTRNLLLDALTGDERGALLADARRREIPVGGTIYDRGDRLDTVAFPTMGTLSLVVDPGEDQRVEALTVGREGAANVQAALGSGIVGELLIGQVPGEMIEVTLDAFTKVFHEGPTFGKLIFGYLEAAFAQSAWNTTCMAVHHVNQRCARWLLQSHDRVDSDTFELKQEFLAIMLGVSRPSVSIAAATLQATGSISYRRGKITIVDREALEDAACVCYEAIRADYSRLVPLQ